MTALNEGVAAELLQRAGLPSQETAHTRLTVSGSGTALRPIIELPDDNFWHIDGAGNNAYLWYNVDEGCPEQFTVVPWDLNISLGVGLNGLCSGECSALPARPNPLTQRFHANPAFEDLYQRTLDVLRVFLFDSGVANDVLDSRAAVLTEQAADLVEPATVTAEADAIRERITPTCVTATIDEHVDAGRATAFSWWAFARSTNAYIGFLGTGQSTSLKGAGFVWSPVESC